MMKVLVPWPSMLVLAACGAGVGVLSPPLTIRVVDARTGSPIAGAHVTVKSREDARASEEGVSGDDGVVRLPPLPGRVRSGAPFVMDRILPPASAEVEASGYKAAWLDTRADRRVLAGEQPLRLVRSAESHGVSGD